MQAVPGLQIAVLAPGTPENPIGQAAAEKLMVAAEAGVEHRDLDALATIAGGMPAPHPERCQVLGTRRQQVGPGLLFSPILSCFLETFSIEDGRRYGRHGQNDHCQRTQSGQ